MKMRKLLNSSEARTHTKLKDVCEKYGAVVYVKVRLADVFPINKSGIENELFRFALQAHFDFVVTDDGFVPQFAVEYDGPTHLTSKQVERDRKKNDICNIFEFPILRINAKYLDAKYRNFDLLSWFIETWFWRKFFFDAQENGIIPMDEIFDPMLIMNIPDKKGHFPLWLSAEPLMKFRELWDKGKIRNVTPNCEYIGVDASGNYFGIAWIKLDDEYGVVTQSAIQAKGFPVSESDILSEILVFQLHEELLSVLDGHKAAITIKEIDRLFQLFEEKYQVGYKSMSSMPSNNRTIDAT